MAGREYMTVSESAWVLDVSRFTIRHYFEDVKSLKVRRIPAVRRDKIEIDKADFLRFVEVEIKPSPERMAEIRRRVEAIDGEKRSLKALRAAEARMPETAQNGQAPVGDSGH